MSVPKNWSKEESDQNCENLINQVEVYVDNFILMTQYKNKETHKLQTDNWVKLRFCSELNSKVISELRGEQFR